MKSPLAFLFVSALLANSAISQTPPPLPPGLDLGSSSEESPASDAPSLPPGLGGLGESTPPKTDAAPSKPSKGKSSLRFSGFLDSRYGIRLQADPFSEDEALSELRLQTQLSGSQGPLSYRMTVDWIADFLDSDRSIDLQTGEGWIDPRELWVAGQPLDFLDLKAGRQINTWGTGDLLFISDLFPKDWRALLLGRDEEYLKAPSDAIKASLYHDWANLDLVYTPEFDPDRFITGERISYFDRSSGSMAGDNRIIRPDYADNKEWSARAHRLFGNAEVALYYHKGFWKQPEGVDPDSGQPYFPRLESISASWRKPVASGILNFEVGRYRSLDDKDGTNPSIRNSETRFLIGFEREIAKNLTGSAQYYLERIGDYAAQVDNAPSGASLPDRTRHVVTLRLTKLMMMQDLRLSLFAFYSPSDEDGYLRPSLSYAINDQWKANLGANLFFGQTRQTFFGQLKDNNNAYLSLRRSF